MNQQEVTLSLRPAPSRQVQIGPSLARNINNQQFVRTFGDPDAEATFGRRIASADSPSVQKVLSPCVHTSPRFWS
jgi:hypothetical protein